MENTKFVPQSAASIDASNKRFQRFAATMIELHKAKLIEEEGRERKEYLRLKKKFEAK